MASTTELILRFTGDQRQLKETIAAVRADLSRLSTGQATAVRESSRQIVAETTRTEKQRIAETIKSANQRLKEEQRAAREVARIVAETARQADRQEAIRERAAKRLADAQIREAKRAAKELEKSLAAGVGGGDIAGTISSFGNAVPALGRLTSQFSNVSTAAAGAGGAIAAAAVPLGLLVAGATAGVAVLGLLAKSLFDAAKEAAEFQGKFKDLSQQVGVAVETLSTLDVIASTTGGNIETVTASLGIFQKGLENAHDPTSKEAKLLNELGVTSLETETALRQTLAGLFRMGEGAKQTDAVLQLFGRSGRFVNAILKESQGDLDAATKKFQLMGLIVSTEAAVAADQFNDSLEILNRQFAVITRTLLSDTIPVFIVLFEELSRGLTGNANAWQSWGKIIEVEIAGVIGIFKTLVQFVASRGAIDFESALAINIQGILAAAEKVRNKIRFEADIERLQRLTAGLLAGRPGDTPNADKARAEAAARAAKSVQLQQKALEESTRVHREELERERDRDLKSIDDWQTESIAAAATHRSEQIKIYDDELANARRFITNREDLLLAEIEIEQKRIKITNDTVTAIQKINDEANKRRDQAELNLNQQLLKIRDAQRNEELRQIKSDLDQGVITEFGAIQRRMALVEQEFADRKVLRDLEREQQSTSAARKIELDNDEVESDQKKTTELKRLSEERIAALVREGNARTQAPGGRVPEIVPNLPEPPDFSIWEQTMEALFRRMVEFSDFLRTTFIQSIFGVSEALGQGVAAWALYGGSFAKAMKQALAALGAKIAAEAIMQAALHAAYAIGSAAFGNFGAAAQHALAAAKFAALGGIAALATRALAGNDFASGGGNAFTGGGTGGSQDRRAPGASPNPQPFDASRPTNQPTVIQPIVVIRGEATEGFRYIVEKVITESYRDSGKMRDVVHHAMGDPGFQV